MQGYHWAEGYLPEVIDDAKKINVHKATTPIARTKSSRRLTMVLQMTYL
jgi:hypothetical protein